MGQPFVGEIRMVAFSFNPVDWQSCDGALLAISENPTLFQLIGTTYGGDGQSTFALPGLQSRVPVHQGSGYVLGQLAGTETVTLTTNQIPAHSHILQAAASAGTQASPSNAVWAESALEQYSTVSPTATMGATLAQTGGSQPHNNLPPFLAINYIISLFGVFPTQG